MKQNYIRLPLLLSLTLCTNIVYGASESVTNLSNPWLLSILVIIGIVAMVVELTSPGFGLGAGISALSFLLFFYGSFGANIASFFSIGLFILGIVLIIIEILIPGFGLPGISGIIAVILGLTFSFSSIEQAIITIGIAIIISVLLVYFFIKLGIHSNYLAKTILSTRMATEDDSVSQTLKSVEVGIKGIAATDLRPSGYAYFEDEKYDVLAKDGYITKGTPIEIVEVKGYQIYVKELNK